MIFDRQRVEEDLARIQHANLPDRYPPPLDKKKKKSLPANTGAEESIGGKDILAMIIAVFSIIIPYVLVIVGGMALFMLGWFWLFG